MVTFNYLIAGGKPRQVRLLKRFIPEVFRIEGRQLHSINYIFCSDEHLLGINRDYLNHHFYTDIITFELNSNEEPVISDIYISTDRVRENAATLKEDYQTELRRVMIHGVLHLCGYRDKSGADKKKMRMKEDFYLGKFQSFFSRGTSL
ncbi:MAG: rRNA maturation RNase YbeY [Sphingobacteriales bacterium]|nr:MAG: rRNA maturation RNase YbeY [Sphingobacteriales bacterium]